MDGQLGINGEDSHDSIGDKSLVPCILNKFLELHPPDSSADTPEEGSKSSLKVLLKLNCIRCVLRYTNRPR